MIMRYLLVLLVIVSASCNCPECPEQEVIIKRDTIKVEIDNTCYPCIDSAAAVKQAEIDRLYQEAMDEVTENKEASDKEIDSLRAVYIAWKDSLRGTVIYGNIIIENCDSVDLDSLAKLVIPPKN